MQAINNLEITTFASGLQLLPSRGKLCPSSSVPILNLKCATRSLSILKTGWGFAIPSSTGFSLCKATRTCCRPHLLPNHEHTRIPNRLFRSPEQLLTLHRRFQKGPPWFLISVITCLFSLYQYGVICAEHL